MVLKLKLVQMRSKVNDKHSNLTRMLDHIDDAAKAGVDLIAFPELILSGYYCREKVYDLAEPIPGPSVEAIAKSIQGRGIYVTFGMPEIRNTFLYNSAPLIGPDGLVGVSRKTFLATNWTPIDTFDEGVYFKPGSDIVTLDWTFGKLGITVCMDIMYPELDHCHAYNGALLMLNLSAAPSGLAPYMQFLARARAIENCVWFGLVNTVGLQDKTEFGGSSCIVNQAGEVIKSSPMGEKLGESVEEDAIEMDIDMEEALKTRLKFGQVRDLRADIFRKAADIVSKA